MDKKDASTIVLGGDAKDSVRPLKLPEDRTETIDLTTLYPPSVTVTGSFDLREVKSTSLGQLLEALPLAAVAVDESHTIIFANAASKPIAPEYNTLEGLDISYLFPDAGAGKEAMSVLETVFATRKPKSIEAVLGVDRGRIIGRVSFRPIRLGASRSVLLLVEDLTVERKQVLIIKRHAQGLRTAQRQLETRVQERTAELTKANEKLKREIIDRRRVQSNLTLAANVIRSSNEAIVITDADANIVDVNDAFCEVTGYTRAELRGKNPKIMQSGRHDSTFWKQVWETLAKTGQWRGEVWDRRKNGEIFPKLLSISAITNTQGLVTHYVGIFSDISRIKHTEKELERLAHFDPLTGLANRVLFRDRLNQAILEADRTGKKVALLFLDLDGFKYVNDTLGHPVGDELLNAVGRRLADCMRKNDTVARLGGDEFTLIVTDFVDTRNVDVLTRRIVERCAEPFVVAGRKVFITTSIGITTYPNDGHDVDRLLQNADTAMYQAKGQGKNGFKYFSPEMNVEAMQRLELETALREGLRCDEFVVHYQPQVDLARGGVPSCEALVRWNHPKQGIVPPGMFIELAEKTGLIRPLGEWVMRSACEQVRMWQRQGLPPLRVAVNISGRQINGNEIVQTVFQVLADTGITAGLLDLEVTESVVMSAAEESVRILTELKKLGVKLSIDDFGTGYSSLSYLKRFPVDKIKIDQSFIRDVTTDPDDATIVKTMIAMAHSMNIKVTAEGVESVEQLDFLRCHGCDEVQGFYYSLPVPPDQFATLFKSGFKPA